MGRCLFEARDQIDVLCINKFGQKQVFLNWRVRTRWLGEQMHGDVCLKQLIRQILGVEIFFSISMYVRVK